jgi:protein-S-isoprenylcysteine O-methyltransferase Ste14
MFEDCSRIGGAPTAQSSRGAPPPSASRAAAAAAIVIDCMKIAAEEPALLTNFGADYEAYRASVPRWLDRHGHR